MLFEELDFDPCDAGELFHEEDVFGVHWDVVHPHQ